MKKVLLVAGVAAIVALSLPVVGCGGNSNVKEYKKSVSELTRLVKKAGEDVSELGLPSVKEFEKLSASDQAAAIAMTKVAIATVQEELGKK